MTRKQTSGFTMVEVIAVLVLIGILSAVAYSTLPQMGESEFAERLLLKTNLRYARQRATDSLVNWSVSFSGGSYTLMRNGVSGETFPATQSGTHTPDVSFTAPAQLEFEAKTGELTVASAQTITFDAGSTVTVHPTGCIP